jgi:multiple sugar transport system permease protein
VSAPAEDIRAAYAFARLHFPGRDKIFVLYLGTLIIPQEVIVVPMFILMKNLRCVDSYQALILPWAFTAFGTFLLRQFFRTIPGELEDAAWCWQSGDIW